MAILDIKKYGSTVLRKKAEAVSEVTPELVTFAEDMLETMYDAPGVGLAAPQVGRSIQLIVVDVSKTEENNEPYIIFNPEITPVEGCETDIGEEGCLSVPDIYAEVERPSVITLTGLNERGESIEFKEVDGFLARCFQHEVDHLNGALFVDKINATSKAMLKSKLKKMAKDNK
ncbi:MAG: peptide deformylase [Fibrobacterales bacterium]